MNEKNIGTVTESAAEAESFNDEDFIGGLFDGENFAEEDNEDPFAKTEDEDPFGEEPKETAEPEAKTEESAESEPNPEENPEEELSFVEHGKTFSVSKKAVEGLANALGITAESLIDIYQKGCGFDAQKARLEAAQNDSNILDELAKMRGYTPEQMRTELRSQLESVPLAQAVAKIKEENPDISDELAKELAKYRVEAGKPKAEQPKQEEEEGEEKAARLREVDMFQAKHPELGKLPNEVIETWEKSGVPLEKAFEDFKAHTRNAELEKEIAELKKQLTAKEQINYAKEHSPGSSASPNGEVVDDFIKGLFAEY